MADNRKEQEREELHRTIWSIANDLRGSVDGWDFKQYVLGMLFYRYISENFANYINEGEREAGDATFDYAALSDADAEQARADLIETKGFFILPSQLFANVRKSAPLDENLNETLEAIFTAIEDSAKGSDSEDDFKGLFDDMDVNSNKLGGTVAERNKRLVKLMNGVGEKMDDALQAELEAFIDGDPAYLPWATEGKVGKTIDFYSGRNRYIGYLTSLPSRSFEKHKVGLDCANGSSWMIGRAVFDALGAKTYVINDQPDGVNINTDCGSTHIEGLQLYVREHHLDVGFAFDGDADRCLAVDERGQVLNGDKIMYICAKHFKERGQLPGDTVVTTVMSNFGLYKALDKAGIRYEKTAVGDRYVYENMKENDFMIGGEQSGHIIFRKYAHTGDGLITALMLMQVMIDTQLPLSVLATGVTMYPQVLKNVRVDDKDLTLADSAVQAAVDECTAELGDSGRVLLRKSGTEPVLRVMAEAGTAEECEKQVDRIIAAMEKSGHLIEVKK